MAAYADNSPIIMPCALPVEELACELNKSEDGPNGYIYQGRRVNAYGVSKQTYEGYKAGQS